MKKESALSQTFIKENATMLNQLLSFYENNKEVFERSFTGGLQAFQMQRNMQKSSPACTSKGALQKVR